MSPRPHFLDSLAASTQTTGAVLRNARTGNLTASRVEPAFDSPSRRRGLLGRDSLPLGTTLIIAPCESVHTFFMRFAIDLLFVSRTGEILKIRQNVRPWRMAIAFGAFATLEFAAGSPGVAEARVGDRLIVETDPRG